MTLIRLILLVLVGAMIRRLYRSVRGGAAQTAGRRERTSSSQPPSADGREFSDLTEQGIDDADFEEIP